MKSKETMKAKARSTTKKAGRPSIDAEELMAKVLYDAPKALSEPKLVKFLNIADSTYYDLKARNPEFAEVIKEYKRISPIAVLSSLKKICVGYEYDETVRELEKDKKSGRKRLVVKKVTRKFVTPNASAIQYYLNNRMSELFKQKVETEHTFSGLMENITFVIQGKSQ
jgi:hypothetical protein